MGNTNIQSTAHPIISTSSFCFYHNMYTTCNYFIYLLVVLGERMISHSGILFHKDRDLTYLACSLFYLWHLTCNLAPRKRQLLLVPLLLSSLFLSKEFQIMSSGMSLFIFPHILCISYQKAFINACRTMPAFSNV